MTVNEKINSMTSLEKAQFIYGILKNISSYYKRCDSCPAQIFCRELGEEKWCDCISVIQNWLEIDEPFFIRILTEPHQIGD